MKSFKKSQFTVSVILLVSVIVGLLFPSSALADEEDTEYSANDTSSFNGARIGVNSNSLQEEMLAEWPEDNDVDIEIVPLTATEDESQAMVSRHELDGYASILILGYLSL